MYPDLMAWAKVRFAERTAKYALGDENAYMIHLQIKWDNSHWYSLLCSSYDYLSVCMCIVYKKYDSPKGVIRLELNLIEVIPR